MRHSTKKNIVPEITLDLYVTPGTGAPVHALIEEKRSRAAGSGIQSIDFHVTEKDFSGLRLFALPASFEVQVHIRLSV